MKEHVSYVLWLQAVTVTHFAWFHLFSALCDCIQIAYSLRLIDILSDSPFSSVAPVRVEGLMESGDLMK